MTDYSHGSVEITTTATLIGPFPIGGATPDEPNGPGDWLKNTGPETVYLGAASVVADLTNGFGGLPLEPGEKLLLAANGTHQYDLWAITGEGVAYLTYLGA
jgi:hypothetical protein